MATDTPAPPSNRPRPWLLVALGVVLALYLALTFWPSQPGPAPVNAPAPRPAARAAGNGTIDPEDLKVRLEALESARPDPVDVDRNPFRFQPKAVPPPPASSAPPVFTPPLNPAPAQPVGPPPIPLKFIGIVEGRSVGKVAAFSDCKRTFYGREGDVVDGRYKLLKIGVESVTMSYPDGRDPQTIRLSGQECIGK